MRLLSSVPRASNPLPQLWAPRFARPCNATFGNVPEIFIGGLALHHGYIALTKATIAGSVIGNASLVLGLALFLGGVRNGTQRFDAVEAGHHAVLMVLAVAALLLPSIYATTVHDARITEISVVAGCLLLAVYVSYLLFSIFQVHGGPRNQPPGLEDGTFIEDEARRGG